jgi:Protein of unknown function (DUF3455)
MKHRYASRIGLVALLILIASCATVNRPAAPVVPASLQVPTTQVLSLQAHAIGVQIYECQASHDDPTRFDWVFKAPEAQLFDHAGKPIIKHYAGPTWEASDGSTVVGEVTAKDNGPDPMAIPWLLLRAKSTSGHGSLSRTQSIQRLITAGGKAPAGGCGAALLGSEVRMHYTADYLFYRARS